MTTFSPDRLASKCADIVDRFREVHENTRRELEEAKARRAALSRPAPIDTAADAHAVAKAQAADAVHGTSTAGPLTQRLQADADQYARDVEAFEREAAELDAFIAAREVALAGAESAIADASASSRAATERAARAALDTARAQYREAVLAVFGLAQQVWALETLAQLSTWPDHRAFTTQHEPMELPGLGAFADHPPQEARSIGVQADPGPAGRVRLPDHHAQQHALALFHSIKAQLEARATTTTAKG
ncbi:hypothetical protein [Aquabacterium sp.]|uniref:hypothetical protein n=1 Tax=Aquabacterium sp. TaxID=1872578 RepID=UPI003784B9A1